MMFPSYKKRIHTYSTLENYITNTFIHTGAPVAAAPVAEAFDPWEIMDPVEILSKLPKDFFEQVSG